MPRRVAVVVRFGQEDNCPKGRAFIWMIDELRAWKKRDDMMIHLCEPIPPESMETMSTTWNGDDVT